MPSNAMPLVEYREYPSSQDPALALYARFSAPAPPRPLKVEMHGWHGQVKKPHADNVAAAADGDWFRIEPEMRGRGDSSGRPDANGWELNDVVDAVEFAKREYASRIAAPECVCLSGGSGGGGNVLGLLGKFPDYFCAAVCLAGIGDYGLWYRQDQKGEFRDELEGKGWIGGTPSSNPEGYASRGGIATLANLFTPLLLIHGELDDRCRVDSIRAYVNKARAIGKGPLVTYLELKGVGLKGHFGGITSGQQEEMRRLVASHWAVHNRPVDIPAQGRLAVAGYLKTRRFEVILDHVDRLAEVTYDLSSEFFEIRSSSARSARLNIKRETGWVKRDAAVTPSR